MVEIAGTAVAGMGSAASDATRRNHGSTLSSMHQFQQQLDEKISSLQERLSSYRSRLSNEGAASSASANAAAEEASMQVGMAEWQTAVLAAQQRGNNGNNESSSPSAAAAALAEYPNLRRMGLEGYARASGSAAAAGHHWVV